MKIGILCLLFALGMGVWGAAVQDSAGSPRGGAAVSRPADSLAQGHAAVVVPSQETQQTKKISIIKRDINYSLFMKLAIGMMCFIALFYVSAQTWNPG